MDNVPGTAGNDTIIADNTGTNKQLSVVDSINGGAGTDTLKVYSDGTAAGVSFAAAQITGVENLYVNNLGNNNLDVSKVAGLTGLTVDSSNVTIDMTGATGTVDNTRTLTLAGQAVTLSNIKGTTSNGATVAQNSTTTVKLASTTDTSESVTLNAVTSGAVRTVAATDYTDTVVLDIAGTKVTSLNLTATGAASTVTLTNSAAAAPLTTLTIAGDKALTLTENLAGLKTINASSATGNVTVNASSANAALAFTGGAGNDKLVLDAGTLVKTQVLDGGAGTDTLVIKDVAINGTTTDLNTSINAAKNFEVLGFGAGTGIAVDLSKVTAVSQFSVEAAITGASGAAAATFSGESNTQSIIINAGLTGGAAASVTSAGNTGLAVTAALDNGSNAATLTLNGVTIAGSNGGATSGNGGSAIDMSNFETVTIHSNANAAGTVTTNTLTAGTATSGSAGSGLLVGANATVTIDGAAAASFGSIVSNPGQVTNNNLTLNAGSLTGNLTVTTGAGNDVITGGSGVNNITLGGGVDTVDLSKSVAKADTVTLSAGTVKAGIAITGFTDALNTGDTLNLAGTTTIATSGAGTVNTGLANAVTATVNSKGFIAFSAVGTSATTADYIDAAFKAVNSANGAAAFTIGSDTYVIQDNGTAGTYDSGDMVVKLVGLTGVAGLSTSASAADTILVA